MKWHARTTMMALGLLLAGCGTVISRSNPFEASESRLVRIQVENYYRGQVSLRVITSEGAPSPLGSINSSTAAEFSIPWSKTTELGIEISALDGGRYRTPRIVTGPGDRVRLRIAPSLRDSNLF